MPFLLALFPFHIPASKGRRRAGLYSKLTCQSFPSTIFPSSTQHTDSPMCKTTALSIPLLTFLSRPAEIMIRQQTNLSIISLYVCFLPTHNIQTQQCIKASPSPALFPFHTLALYAEINQNFTTITLQVISLDLVLLSCTQHTASTIHKTLVFSTLSFHTLALGVEINQTASNKPFHSFPSTDVFLLSTHKIQTQQCMEHSPSPPALFPFHTLLPRPAEITTLRQPPPWSSPSPRRLNKIVEWILPSYPSEL